MPLLDLSYPDVEGVMRQLWVPEANSQQIVPAFSPALEGTYLKWLMREDLHHITPDSTPASVSSRVQLFHIYNISKSKAIITLPPQTSSPRWQPAPGATCVPQ